MGLIREGSVCLEIGKCSEEGDPEYKRVGPGDVAVSPGWSVWASWRR